MDSVDTVVQDITREDVVLRRIFDDILVQNRILPHLDPDLFDNEVNRGVVKLLNRYYAKYRKFPSTQTIVALLPSSKERTQIMRLANLAIDNIDREAATDLVTSFFVEQRTKMLLTEAAESIHERDFTNIAKLTEKLKDAVNFSLYLDVGLDVVEDAEEALRRLNETMRAIPSALEDVNRITASYTNTGGWYRKSLSIFLGMPNVGKSILLCNEAAYAYQQGYNVLYISLEMSEELIWERVASNVTDIPMGEIRSKNADEVQELLRRNKAENAHDVGEIIVKHMPTTTTVNEIESLLQEIKRSRGIDIDIMFVDYIGIMKPARRKNTIEQHSLYTMGKEIAEQLRDLANIYEIAVVTASQFNREGYETTQSSMKNTAGSAGLNDTADFMITITQEPMLKEHKMFLHMVLKNRFGPNSVAFVTRCQYDKMRVRKASDSDQKEYHNHMVSQESVVAGFGSDALSKGNPTSAPKPVEEVNAQKTRKRLAKGDKITGSAKQSKAHQNKENILPDMNSLAEYATKTIDTGAVTSANGVRSTDGF